VPRHSESTLAAIKQAVDIVALIGGYLPLHRAGSKYKVICPFHNDHNPSLEINPERQSYKCWVCGAGGDVFDFVKNYEHVEFPEALRMLADRAGIALDAPGTADVDPSAPRGPSKADQYAAMAWAESLFAGALAGSPETLAYVQRRGLSQESVQRFGLGYAPDERDWIVRQASLAGHSRAVLEAVGLVAKNPETGIVRDRFRGRLIFPIHDMRGRAIGFGGRILPDAEKRMANRGAGVAKYLNSPETSLFQKRKNLYAADLARPSAREAGWVAVVEGYTDVIAAHQVGLTNVVGSLGTALGDDHITALRRIADRVVLVFDGDEAGQKAADRSLELFLGHEVDVRVLTLPDGLDPCDFLLLQGASPFRDMVEQAIDPLDFAINRAASRFGFDTVEGARQAASWVLTILAKVPTVDDSGQIKVSKALDHLSRRLRVPMADLQRSLRQERRNVHRASRGAEIASASFIPGTEPAATVTENPSPSAVPPSQAIRPSELDPLDRQLVEIALSTPEVVSDLITIVDAGSLRDAPLRTILQTSYDLHGEGRTPNFENISLRLEDSATRALAAGLLLPIDPQPLNQGTAPAPTEARLAGLLARYVERRRREQIRDLEMAMAEIDPNVNPDEYRALWTECFRLRTQRPETRKKTAS
jgi:DNA primase